jgi:error-prone DNA polymerase
LLDHEGHDAGAAFAFCKAHAVTYGRIAYRTAWLKAHHPAAFLTAFLASETGYYPRRVYVEEARRLGVPILGPSVNHSERTFSVEWMVQAPSAPAQPALRTGLSQVKGLSHTTLERLFTSRATDGAFLSLPDLLDRTGAHVDEAEHLIQSGALDDFDRTRPELLWRLHLLRSPRQRLPRGEAVREGGPLDMALLDACRATPASRREEVVRSASANTGAWGQAGLGFGGHELSVGEVRSLFPAPPLSAVVLPGLPDTDRHTRGRLEFECLGFTITDHPLRIFPCPADERAAANGRRLPRATPCAKLEQFRGGRITLRGWPAATRRLQTEEGSWMRFLTLEDESGVAEVVLFPDVYRRDGHLLSERGSLCITGVVDEQMGAHTLRAERIW